MPRLSSLSCKLGNIRNRGVVVGKRLVSDLRIFRTHRSNVFGNPVQIARDQTLREVEKVGRRTVVDSQGVGFEGFPKIPLGLQYELRDRAAPLKNGLVIVAHDCQGAAIDAHEFLNEKKVKRVYVLEFVDHNVMIAVWFREGGVGVFLLQGD